MNVFVALVIQHAKRMRPVKLSSVSCPALQYSSHYLLNDIYIFFYVIEHKNACFDFLFTLFETFLNIRRTERDIVINVHKSSCKVPVILSDFKQS